MDFRDYQEAAAETAIYPTSDAVTYPALGLASEAGEVAGKVKKIIRDHGGDFRGLTPPQIQGIQLEIGGVLWYCAAICGDLGLELNDCAKMNLAELKSRQERGVLQGSGDHR